MEEHDKGCGTGYQKQNRAAEGKELSLRTWRASLRRTVKREPSWTGWHNEGRPKKRKSPKGGYQVLIIRGGGECLTPPDLVWDRLCRQWRSQTLGKNINWRLQTLRTNH